MMQPDERHELFEDELFARSQTWKLSTSGLSDGDQFRGTGFGSPEPDGYGINCKLCHVHGTYCHAHHVCKTCQDRKS